MKRLRRLAVLLAIALAVATVAGVVVGCGSGSGSSSSSSTSAAAIKTYKDSTYGYSFEYPSSWSVQQAATSDVTAGGTSAGSVGVFNPNGAKAGSTFIDLMLVSVYKLNISVNDSNLPQIKTEIETVLKSLESQGTDMRRQKDLAPVTVAGMKGYNVTYNFTKQGVPCTSTLYFLFNGTIEYQLTTQASNDNWAANQPIFDAMIASFKPGPAK